VKAFQVLGLVLLVGGVEIAGPTSTALAQDTEQQASSGPAAVVQQLVAAALANDAEKFSRLVEPDARFATSREPALAPVFAPLTLAEVAETFRNCELKSSTESGIAAFVAAKCPSDSEAQTSSFIVVNGRVRIFYKHMLPLVMVRPANG